MTFLIGSIKKKTGLRRYIGPKRIVFLFVLSAAFFMVWKLYHNGNISPIIIQQYQHAHPLVAILLFIVFFALSVLVALPSLPLNLAAGFFWGGVLGGLYSTLGATIGGWASFAIARWFIGQPLAEKFDNKWVSRVQSEFIKNDWKFVAFARINPIIPTGPLNYLLGLTTLSNKNFLWTTFLFLLPPSIAVGYIGDTLQTFTAEHTEASNIIHSILIVSAAVTFLAFLKFCFKIFSKQAND